MVWAFKNHLSNPSAVEGQVQPSQVAQSSSNLALSVYRDEASTNCQVCRDLFLASRKPVVEGCECPTGQPNPLSPNLALTLCQNKNTKNPLESSDGTGSRRKRNLTRDIYSMEVIAIRNDNKEQTLLPGVLGEISGCSSRIPKAITVGSYYSSGKSRGNRLK